jgi:hypothetical protein
MHFEFETRPPESPLVERVWRTWTERDGHFTSMASTNWEMVVFKYQGQTTFTLRGPETKPSPLVVEAGIEFVGITFKLGTFMPHLPLTQIMDRQDVNLPEATSKSFYLHGSAWQFPTFENVDTFIKRLAQQELIVQDAVVRDVLNQHDQHPMEITERTVRRHFLRATGLTHGTIVQIERARRATELLGQGCSILDVVFEAGYYDQAHLTRSLKRFMGQTPAQVLRVETE